jgi:hypothetical protein
MSRVAIAPPARQAMPPNQLPLRGRESGVARAQRDGGPTAMWRWPPALIEARLLAAL